MNSGTVITNNQGQMIGDTGWSWADAVDVAREHARERRLCPDPVERALARYHELEDGVVFFSGEGGEVSMDEVIEHRRDEKELRRTHRSRAQQIAHRHGECSCFQRS